MPRIPKPAKDRLEHFKNDPPLIRLAALFFVRAHLILASTGFSALALTIKFSLPQ